MSKLTNEEQVIYKIQHDECLSCDGHEESNCCHALIIEENICSECGEECTTTCANCELNKE